MSARNYGPFKVIERIGEVDYRLQLPEQWSIHPVFHISKLKKNQDDVEHFPDRERETSRPPPIVQDVENQLEYEVDRVVGIRMRRKGKKMVKEYLVLWKGYPEWERTWEPEANLQNAQQAIRDFERS